MTAGSYGLPPARTPRSLTAGAAHGPGTPAAAGSDRRRWTSLVCVAVAQLMVALDATIMNIALPSAQRALDFSNLDRQWVVTAYSLAFAGLLLLGGRLSDLLGRKRAFLIGLAGFAPASALGGAAPSLAVLVGARALQGAFAALLTPTALSLLAVTFTEPRERAKAFAIYGGIAGGGAALGLLVGGALTQYLTWRWCLYVNVPIAIGAALMGGTVLAPSRAARGRRLDLPGVLLASACLVALVYGCAQAGSQGWGSGSVVGPLLASAGLLILFGFWEARATTPLLPLRVVLDRNRGGAYLSALLAIAGMYGAFLFLTYYLQVVLHYSPLQAGLAFLPLTLASQFGSWAIARQLLPRVAARLVLAPGLVVAAAGMAWLTQLRVTGGYGLHVLPAEVLLGLGIACAMVPAFSVGTQGVAPQDIGAASATVTAAQQIGASVGTALLNTIAASATVTYLALHAGALERSRALVHGYSAATAWGAVILLAGALVAALLMNRARPAPAGSAPSPS